MEDLPPRSRLALVRSQLRMDSDSEESASITALSVDTEADTEPFPEYDESACDKVALYIAAEKPHEEAWIYACGKFAQEQIRLHEVDPNLIPYVQSDPSQRSQVVLQKLRDLLADPQMRPETRRQFIALVNTTLHLNHVIFHQSVEFLAPKEISDARVIAEAILTNLVWMDALLKEQLKVTNHIATALEQILQENISAFDQLRKMASYVAEHMKKPRRLEQKLLILFQEVYEQWVHNPFLRLRSRQVLNDRTLYPSRSELARYITSIEDMLKSCIEGYALFVWATMEIKHNYFAPTMEYLCESPEIWRQCWEEYHQREYGQHQRSERDPSRTTTL